MKALVIIAGIVLFLAGDFLLAWFLGSLWYHLTTKKEEYHHDHDA